MAKEIKLQKLNYHILILSSSMILTEDDNFNGINGLNNIITHSKYDNKNRLYYTQTCEEYINNNESFNDDYKKLLINAITQIMEIETSKKTIDDKQNEMIEAWKNNNIIIIPIKENAKTIIEDELTIEIDENNDENNVVWVINDSNDIYKQLFNVTFIRNNDETIGMILAMYKEISGNDSLTFAKAYDMVEKQITHFSNTLTKFNTLNDTINTKILIGNVNVEI